MKKIFLIFVLCILLVSTGCSNAIETETYINEEYGFSVNYPSDWQVGEKDSADIVNIYGVDSPWKDIYFVDEDNIGVCIFILTISYSDESRISFDLDRFGECLWGDWRDEYDLLLEEDIIIDGISAEKITFEYSISDVILRRDSTILFVNREMSLDKAFYYAITYGALVNLPKDWADDMRTYDEGYKYFDLIVNSFEFSDIKK